MDDTKGKLLSAIEAVEGMMSAETQGDADDLEARAKAILEDVKRHQSEKSSSKAPKDPKKLKLTKKMVKEALEKTRGNLALSARSLGVSRQTVYSYIERYPELKDIRADAVEYITDIAEGHAEAGVMSGNDDWVKFWLRYRAKSRGWSLSNDVKMESALQLSPDVLELMKAHNIAIGDVARELELLLREAGHGDTTING
jgi:hypothetical protein